MLNITEIGKTLKDNEIIVFVFKNNQYNTDLKRLVKDISKTSKKICYISLNKPYNNLLKILEKSKISDKKFFFIDCVTRKIMNVKDTESVTYISSPQAFTELNISINKTLQKGEIDASVFDSLSTLLVYGDSSVVIKFIHSVISNFRAVGVKGIFTVLKDDIKSNLLKDLGMFADIVVDI